MKNLFTIIFIFALCNYVICQTTNNPFNSKIKNNTSSNLNTQNLNPITISGNLYQNNSNGFVPYNISYQPINKFVKPQNNKSLNKTKSYYNNDGQLIFTTAKLNAKQFIDIQSNNSIAYACFEYLNALKAEISIIDPSHEFTIEKTEKDDLGQIHVKMQQIYNNVPVYGSEVILHIVNGEITHFNGSYYPTPQINNFTPNLNVENAVNITVNDIKNLTTYRNLSENDKQLLKYSDPEYELVIYHKNRNIKNEELAWHITLRPNFIERWEYFIDAQTGEIIHKYNNTCSDGPVTANAVDLNGTTRTIHTYLNLGTYYMIDASQTMYNSSQSNMPNDPVGTIWTLNANNTSSSNFNVTQISSTNNTWNIPASVSAHYNAYTTYNYYKNTHSRNSLNNLGGNIISIINVTESDGSSMENAYWNGQVACFGNGGSTFKPLAGSLDVAAHEFGHAVVSNTANLEYQDQSGAINETFADISGAMVDRSDWLIGEDILNSSSYFPTGALRDMSNPHNGGSSFSDACYQPANLSEMYTGTQDNGGVHINSGIGNYAYYLYATAVTKEKAEKVFYRALTTYLTKSSQFIDLRLAVIQSAVDLYGSGSTEETEAKNAFNQVGITDGQGGDYTSDLQINPGQDYLLSYDVNTTDPTTLYSSSTSGTNYVALSQTNFKRRPSVPDNGSFAVFVSSDSKLKTLSLSGTPNESDIQNQPIWDNVAISKDGTKIAALTTSIDTSIYIYNYNTQIWAKFQLYNPTHSDVNSGGVLYADELEWDYSGQYVMYDAYNEINSTSGQDISYWDVGFIKVWDNATNNWGDGTVSKLFSNLPEGVSIADPSFSKNSPYIVAFDYIDNTNSSLYILTANIETGDVGNVYNNTVLSYPNYSKLDDKIAFTAINTSNDTVVAVIGLQSDKLNPNGSPSIIIPDAKWPIWYSQGSRQLSVNDVNNSYNSFVKVYPNPATSNITFEFNSSNNKSKQTQIIIYNIFGQVVYNNIIQFNSIEKTIKNIEISNLNNGTYFAKCIFDNNTETIRFVKLK